MEPFQIASLALGGAGFLGNLGQSIFGNQANRNFQAQQAQIARDWQEDFYNKYSSPSAMVQQYKDAGLNPAIMYGRGSSVVGGVPSGASPIGGSQMQSDLSGLMNIVPSIVQMKEMIKNNESLRNLQNQQANLFSSQTTGQDLLNKFNPEVYQLNLRQGKLNLQNTLAGIKLAESQTKLNLDGLLNNDVTRRYYNNLSNKVGAETAKTILEQSLVVAETLLRQKQGYQIDLDNFEKEWRNAMIATKGINPEIANNAWSLMTQATAEASNRITGGISKAVNWIKSDPLKQLYYRYFRKK